MSRAIGTCDGPELRLADEVYARIGRETVFEGQVTARFEAIRVAALYTIRAAQAAGQAPEDVTIVARVFLPWCGWQVLTFGVALDAEDHLALDLRSPLPPAPCGPAVGRAE